MTILEFIDCSNFQPSQLNYQAIASAGIAGALVKASDGLHSPDPSFKAHVAGFRAARVLCGAYHYLLIRRIPRTPDAEEQAEEFSSYYISENCELPPCVDLEDGENTGTTPAEWAPAVMTFLETVQRITGRTPMVYTYPWFWGTIAPAFKNSGIEKYPLWFAQYSEADPKPPAPWSEILLHQYSETGVVPGIPGHVDRSRSAFPIDRFLKPITPPVPVDPEEIA
jgi:lysozyme